MAWSEHLEALGQIDAGKRVGTALYIHKLLISSLPQAQREFLSSLPALAQVTLEHFNIIKVELRHNRISLLHYPDFWETGFPTLTDSWTIHLETSDTVHRQYDPEGNPPVLHRKELLIPDDHPNAPRFRELTEAAEEAGLFDDPSIIGHQHQWRRELAMRGLRVEGHALVASEGGCFDDMMAAQQELQEESSSEPGDEDEPEIHRHKTAITRRTLSTPMQALWRHGFLDGRYTVFDYGCGQGDDVRALTEAGLTVGAWDPYYRSDGERFEADVVNIGFVINVIEDQGERREALEKAFGLTRNVLAVATLIGGRSAYEKFRLFRDGVVTSIGTFQKYYTRTEFEEYVGDVLGREPVTIAPGVVFVFKTDEQEQEFLAQRQRQRHRVRARRPMPRTSRPRRIKKARSSTPRQSRPKKISRWEKHADLLDDFWQCCLELGRLPEAGEYMKEPQVRDKLGTPKRVLNHLLKTHGSEQLDAARVERMGDTSVYLALNFFERRRSFGELTTRLKRDVKSFWGSYKAAREEAQRLLFSIADPEVISEACQQAAVKDLGYLDGLHSLQLHSSLATELPPVLRVYLGCATKLYGEVEEVDLIKLHIQSGKVSLMLYDDFESSPVPDLIERVKINLRRQRIDFFEYGEEFPPQPLYLKSRFIYEGFDHYDEQVSFDAKLEGLDLFDFEDHGPPGEVFKGILERNRLRIEGFELLDADESSVCAEVD